MIREEDPLTSYRNSRCLSPVPTPTARDPWRTAFRAATALAALLGSCTGWWASPAEARSGDGVLLLSWTQAGAIAAGTSEIVEARIPPGELTVALVGSGRERIVSLAQQAPIRVAGIDPGRVTLELRHGMGVLAVWETLVRAEVSTRMEIDLDLGTLVVSPVSPDPFGNWESWSTEELLILPGLAEDGLRDFDTRAATPQDPILDGIEFARKDRLRPRTIDLDQALVGAQRPLGSAPAYQSGAGGMRLLTRPLPGRGVTVGGSAGNGNRFLGRVQLKDRYSTRSGNALDMSGQIQVSAFDVAGPLEALNATLDHDDETAVEVRARASYDQLGSRLRFDFYALGSERNYHLIEFQEDLDHAPKEDRGSLGATLAYDLRLGAQEVSLEAGFDREFTETGDGVAFDDFSSYRRLRNPPDTRPDGIFWMGDDPSTPGDEGKLFDYYERSLVKDYSLRADLVRDIAVPGGFRAGTEFHWIDWRLFEHMRPGQVVVNGGEAGYAGLTRNFGYTFDGDAREDGSGHGPRQPRQVSIFASQRLSLGSASVEGGLRLDRFSPGQNPLRDLSDPLGQQNGSGDPGAIDPTDLTARPNHSLVSPRVGGYTPIGDQTHLWIDGGRRQIVPPFQAIYYDPAFLEGQVERAGLPPEHESGAPIHGNPDLAPEDEWSGQLGIYHQRSPNLAVRLSGYASRTRDTWVAHSYRLGIDDIDFYENAGERRELGLHLGLELGGDSSSQLRVQYDLSRTETDVIEPEPLYEHLRFEGLPIGSLASPQVRLRSIHWIDDGIDRGFFPSLWDRRHRVSVLWSRELQGLGVGGASARNPRLGLALHAASGAPYTRTFVRSEGDLEESTDTRATTDPSRRMGGIHTERLPSSWQIDFAYTQPFTILKRAVDLRVEIRNLTDHQNPQYVYPATGKADDDGWLATPAGQQAIDQNGDSFRSDYEKAIDSPLNYTEGLNARAAVTVALF